MAVFPGAVKTFTSKSDGAGNKVFASHVNDLQDEVNAIEDALLNASAPLNLQHVAATALSVSAGSTLTTLSVTGVSTLASLQVTGGSTFAGVVNMKPGDAARVELGADQQIASASSVAITWTVDAFQTNSSMHSTSSNPTQVRFQSTGVYDCRATIQFGNDNSTLYVLSMEDSSGGFVDRAILRHRSTGVDDSFTVTLAGFKYVDTLAATPWVRIVVTQTGSTNRIIAASNQTHFDVGLRR